MAPPSANTGHPDQPDHGHLRQAEIRQQFQHLGRRPRVVQGMQQMEGLEFLVRRMPGEDLHAFPQQEEPPILADERPMATPPDATATPHVSSLEQNYPRDYGILRKLRGRFDIVFKGKLTPSTFSRVGVYLKFAEGLTLRNNSPELERYRQTTLRQMDVEWEKGGRDQSDSKDDATKPSHQFEEAHKKLRDLLLKGKGLRGYPKKFKGAHDRYSVDAVTVLHFISSDIFSKDEDKEFLFPEVERRKQLAQAQQKQQSDPAVCRSKNAARVASFITRRSSDSSAKTPKRRKKQNKSHSQQDSTCRHRSAAGAEHVDFSQVRFMQDFVNRQFDIGLMDPRSCSAAGSSTASASASPLASPLLPQSTESRRPQSVPWSYTPPPQSPTPAEPQRTMSAYAMESFFGEQGEDEQGTMDFGDFPLSCDSFLTDEDLFDPQEMAGSCAHDVLEVDEGIMGVVCQHQEEQQEFSEFEFSFDEDDGSPSKLAHL